MWYATARPSCRNVRRTQGFLLQTCFRLRWGLLCYQVKTLSPARKMIRGPRESVFGTQCEQHLNKFQASSCILPTFILSFLSQFTCFAPFFLFCPIVSFFYQFFSFFSHFTNIAGASQCSCCDCNFCKSPDSWFRVVTKNAPIHQLLQNCIAPCVYPLTLFLVPFWDFFVLFDTFFGGLLLNMHCYINCYKTALIPGFALCRLYVPLASKISGNGNFMGPSALLSVSESESCLARRYILESN